MRVAYVVSMKFGLTAWNYREIDILRRSGVDIRLYPTKYNTGPNMPRPDWPVRRPNLLRSLVLQVPAFVSNTGRYLRLLGLALRMGTLVEFVLANDFARDMRTAGVQHIHCHFGDRKLYTGYFCSRILDLPLTVTVHAYEILMNPNPGMFVLAAAACRAVVVQSEFNKSELVRIFGLDPAKIRVVRAHGDHSDERRRTSVKLFIAAEFTEKKGHEVLFAALQKLGRKDLTLWVAGKGKLDLASMAEEAGIADQVVFVGSIGKNLMDILYDACDIFVHPSRTTATGDREGIPAAIMEAMSHHKAVISTRHTGIPELVAEVLVDENDVDGLADAIAYLADNPQVRREMGERNHWIIKENFSEAAVLQLAELFGDETSQQADVEPAG